MDKQLQNYINALLEKSEEAYLMALEIINKPTIKYRTEGFCFFICNAWELLLKAQIISSTGDITSIDFKDKSGRTLGLETCIEKVFPSTTDKTKHNLVFIKSIRNRMTHLIISDYDFDFVPAFQRCITNYCNFFNKHFSYYGLNSSVQPFVSLIKPSAQENDALILGQAKDLYEKLKREQSKNADEITQTLKLVVTKKEEADLSLKYSKDATESAQQVLVPTDPIVLFPYRTKKAITIVQQTVELSLGKNHGFTKTSFERICKDYNIKNNKDYCYLNPTSDTQTTKQYNQSAIEFISEIFLKDPKKYTRKI